jgi:predicted nucleic acid-binding protein
VALETRFLVDKSAIARLHMEAVDAVLKPLLDRRRLATCAVVDLEVLFSARSFAEYDSWLSHRRAFYFNLPITEEIGDRAMEVQSKLAKRSKHRGCGTQDLLIAACAEVYRVPLLHYDRDFDLIASVAGQTTQWVVPRGEVP